MAGRRSTFQPKQSFKSQLLNLVPVLIALGLFASMIWHLERKEQAEWQARQAIEDAETAETAKFFDRARLAALLDHCQERWRYHLNFYQRPNALAFAHHRVDGYFLTGTDSTTWRRASCTPAEVAPGPRFKRALLEGLPAEEAPGTDELHDDQWSQAISRLAGLRLENGLTGLELLQDPRDGRVFFRSWQGVEKAIPAIEPPDAPPFPILLFDPSFSTETSLPTLATQPRFNYLENPRAAFRIIEKALPPGAKISELTLEENKIDLRIEATTPAFEGRPPAPYGDMDFDEYGIAGSSWWYPREDPTFGCFVGTPLPEVEAEILEKTANNSATLVRAWFSCSPAYSDQKKGVWNLIWSP